MRAKRLRWRRDNYWRGELRPLLLERSYGRCEGLLPGLGRCPVLFGDDGAGMDGAHVFGLGRRGTREDRENILNDPANVLALCRDCHRWLDKAVKEAAAGQAVDI